MLLGLVTFKAMGVVFWLLAAALVYLLLRKEGAGNATAGALFLAWNPLLAFETAANGHNDIAMAFLALLAVYALALGRVRLSLPLLMASVLVKFITLVLFPAFLLSWLRDRAMGSERARQAAWGLIWAGLLAAALYAPFWEGFQTLGPLRRTELFTASLPALAFHWLSEQGFQQAGQAVRLGASGVFALFALWRIRQVRPGVEELLATSFDLLFAYFLVATLWFQPWYVISLVPLAAALKDPLRRWLAVVFTASAFLDYFVFVYLWIWNWERLGQVQLQMLAVLAIFGPPVVFLVASLTVIPLWAKMARVWLSGGGSA